MLLLVLWYMPNNPSIMVNKPIQVEIVEENQDAIIVRLPFLEVPIEMNWAFFNKRVEAGYFQLHQQDRHQAFSLKLLQLSVKNKQ